jgi:NAD(P)H-hydrate epimerase
VKVVTTAQMRELDARTIAEFGVPGERLMERAGAGVAAAVRRILRLRGRRHGRVLVVAGRGNNGGDAFVAARHLQERQLPVDVWLAGTADELRGDALTHFNRMRAAGVPCREAASESEWDAAGREAAAEADIVLDGLLGTGISGAPRGLAACAVEFVNAAGTRAPVLAIDVPSGLDSDTGRCEGAAARADVTVTMGLPKRGLLEPPALDCVGSLEVVDIGIPPALIAEIRADQELIAEQDLRPLLGRRPRAAHKGNYGHLLIVSGAAGYAGAVSMAARAALRSGVGLVTVLTPASIAAVVAQAAPEAMVHAAAETEAGSLSAGCLRAWGRDMASFDAVLIGPGLTTHDESRRLTESLLRAVRSPLVVDADGLNVLAGDLDPVRRCGSPVMLTPHPGEMARLLGCSAADVQADRPGSARRAMARARGRPEGSGHGGGRPGPDAGREYDRRPRHGKGRHGRRAGRPDRGSGGPGPGAVRCGTAGRFCPRPRRG